MIPMRCGWALLVSVLAVAGCALPQAPKHAAAPADANAPVARRPLEAPAVPPQALAAQPGQRPGAPPAPIALPPTALYVCVTENAGQRKQTAIEFAPKVGALCQRHPEMGPCQYERDLCRNGGGRVFAANGQEITRQVEDEYDRKVLRVRFRAN